MFIKFLINHLLGFCVSTPVSFYLVTLVLGYWSLSSEYSFLLGVAFGGFGYFIFGLPITIWLINKEFDRGDLI